MSRLWRAIDLVVGGIFLYAGFIKAIAPLRFANDIDHYHLVPWAVGVRLAFYLPWLEILCGFALIFRQLYSGALAIVTALLVMFIGASVIARARGIDVDCGCFGAVGSGLGFFGHLLLDGFILAALLLQWRRRRARG